MPQALRSDEIRAIHSSHTCGRNQRLTRIGWHGHHRAGVPERRAKDKGKGFLRLRPSVRENSELFLLMNIQPQNRMFGIRTARLSRGLSHRQRPGPEGWSVPSLDMRWLFLFEADVDIGCLGPVMRPCDTWCQPTPPSDPVREMNLSIPVFLRRKVVTGCERGENPASPICPFAAGDNAVLT